MTSLGTTKDFRRFDREFAVTNELRGRVAKFVCRRTDPRHAGPPSTAARTCCGASGRLGKSATAPRTRGTDYLLEAARLDGTRRFIAQNFTGFTNEYAGTLVKTEDDPLNPDPPA